MSGEVIWEGIVICVMIVFGILGFVGEKRLESQKKDKEAE